MFEPVDRVFKALADPGRRRLLDALRDENGQTLNQMCAHLDMSRQAVAQHLGVLETASLVVVVWHGREKLHYINPVPLFDVFERWIRPFERSRLAALQDLEPDLEERHDKT
jgi:DNA-binding transcriptional ArsR family regulator